MRSKAVGIIGSLVVLTVGLSPDAVLAHKAASASVSTTIDYPLQRGANWYPLVGYTFTNFHSRRAQPLLCRDRELRCHGRHYPTE